MIVQPSQQDEWAQVPEWDLVTGQTTEHRAGD